MRNVMNNVMRSYTNKALVTAACLLGSVSLYSAAALSPGYQSIAELNALVNLDAFGHLIDNSNGPITRIERVGEDYYRIKTPNCSAIIPIVYIPMSRPGPQAFTFEIPDQMECNYR